MFLMLTHEKILATLNNSPYLGWVVSIGLGVTGGLLFSSLEHKLKHKE